MTAGLVAGCRASEPAATPPACLDRAAVARALERAPAAVALAGGTPLSRCVTLAASREGELQALGLTLVPVADDLRAAARADLASARRLGYLVGAVRRGAARTPGIAAQLVRRLEQIGSLDGAPARRAVRIGVEAGQDGG